MQIGPIMGDKNESTPLPGPNNGNLEQSFSSKRNDLRHIFFCIARRICAAIHRSWVDIRLPWTGRCDGKERHAVFRLIEVETFYDDVKYRLFIDLCRRNRRQRAWEDRRWESYVLVIY